MLSLCQTVERERERKEKGKKGDGKDDQGRFKRPGKIEKNDDQKQGRVEPKKTLAEMEHNSSDDDWGDWQGYKSDEEEDKQKGTNSLSKRVPAEREHNSSDNGVDRDWQMQKDGKDSGL